MSDDGQAVDGLTPQQRTEVNVDIDAPLPSNEYDPAAAEAAATADREAALERINSEFSEESVEAQDDTPHQETDELSEPQVEASAEDTGGEAADGTEAEDGGQPDAEADGDAATAAVLKREKALRDERTALNAEREKFLAERQQLENAFSTLDNDPIAFMKAFGYKDFASLAEQAYNESLGDLAPDEYRQSRVQRQKDAELSAYKRRIEQLEQKSQQAELAQYQQGLKGSLEKIPEQFPSVARLVDTYGQDRVYGDLWSVAQQYAQAGQVATPEQCMQAVEQHYAPLLGAAPEPEPADQAQSAADPKPKKRRSRSLRNNMSQALPKIPDNIDELPEEEQRRIYRQRANAVFQQEISGKG